MEKNNGVDAVPNEVFGAPSLKKGSSTQDDDSGEGRGLLTQSDQTTATKSWLSHNWPYIYWFIKFILVVGTLSVIFSIPIIYYRDAQFLEDMDNLAGLTGEEQHELLKGKLTDLFLYNIFLFLLITWLGIAGFFLIGSALPYIFRFIARYVNPAHVRYWRLMRVFRKPLCYLGGLFIGFFSFLGLVAFNDYLAIALGYEPMTDFYIDFVEDLLQQSVLWAMFYFLEKIAILYVTIHYHFRSDLGRISQSKEMQNALMALYEASLYLYPIGTPEFVSEDAMIGNATGSEHGEHRVRASRYLSRLGIDTYAMTSFFGNFLSSDPNPHWLRPASAYATVERAMANPKSAAALAKRIWMSMVPAGKESLTAADLAEVLGPFRKEEAETYFKSLDQNELGDVRLDELEWTVAEAGKSRNAIYRSMHNADHNINTLDWILLLMIGCVMVLFIMLKHVPSLRDVQETLKFFTVGFAFAIGRTVHHFTAGVIFALFDHPYDIGDRLELWTFQSPNFAPVIVERISLLYTVFRRADTWVEIQVGNEYLQQCRIENITRSGCNREAISIVVDIGTSFQDLKALRAEIDAFVKHADNKRDFLPQFSLAIVSVNQLDKMELKLRFAHRNNFAIEPLKSARHMKLMCAILTACRKLRIEPAERMGQPGRPIFSVQMTEKEANERMAKLNYEMAAARFDAGVALDLTAVQHGEDDGDVTSARAALEHGAAERQAVRKVREAQEKEAAAVLAKLPAIPHKGPPVRTEGDAVSTGVEANVTGMRSLPHFRG